MFSEMAGGPLERILDFQVIERFAWFHRQVLRGRFPNAGDLSRRFEISSKTAQRAVDFFRDRLYAPLEYVPVKRGYRYTEDSFLPPALPVSAEEILAVLMARRLLSDTAGGAISEAIYRFGQKLFSITGHFGLTEEGIDEAFSAATPGATPAPADTFRTVSGALLSHRILEFTYWSPLTDAITQRLVEPHHLQYYIGSWVLFAYCRQRNQWRKFMLARMANPVAREEIFTPRPRNEWADQLEGAFGIFQGAAARMVVLYFPPFRARWIRKQVWHLQQSIETRADGSIFLSFPVADFREVKLKILQFGSEVEVLAPVELRREIQEEIEKMTHIYGPHGKTPVRGKSP